MNPIDRYPAIPALPNQGGQANVPGLRKLSLIEARYVLGMTDPRHVPGGTTAGWALPPNGILLAENAQVVKLTFPSRRCDYNQKQAYSAQGSEYQHLIRLAIPGDDAIRADMVRLMTGRRWIAIYQDANGLQAVVGSPAQPLRFQWQMLTTGYTCTWEGRTPYPAPHLLNLTLFDGKGDFTYAFSNEFNI